MPSRVETTTRCPRLLKRVKDSPQPKSFSSCWSSKVAAMRRERSLARRTKENGTGAKNVAGSHVLRARQQASSRIVNFNVPRLFDDPHTTVRAGVDDFAIVLFHTPRRVFRDWTS